MYTFATSRFDPATLKWLPSVPPAEGFIKPFWVVNMCEGRKWIAHGLVLKDGMHILFGEAKKIRHICCVKWSVRPPTVFL